MDTPLPCPFCGGEARLDSKPRRYGDGMAFFYRCRACACEGPWFKTEGMALRLWNTRAPSSPGEAEEGR